MKIIGLCLTLLILTTFAAFASDMEMSGKAVYEKSCAACHASGVMGAPKVGDKAAWAELIAEGKDDLAKNAIKGIGQMPPKGGNAKLTDDEVEEAVEYMMEMSK